MDNNNPANSSSPIPTPQPVPPQPLAPTPQKTPYHLTLLNKISIFVVAIVLLGIGLYEILPRSGPDLPTKMPQPPTTMEEQLTPAAQPSATTTTASPTAPLSDTSSTMTPPDPTGLNVVCNIASSSATLTWNTVAGSDLYFVHIRGGKEENTRVYTPSHTVPVEAGKTYTWWMEAVKHNSDFSQAYASKSISGPSIKCN